jgi:transcription-repair coupling factor (superfamily II helicase)
MDANLASKRLEPWAPNLPLPLSAGAAIEWGGLSDGAIAMALAHGAKCYPGLSLVITPDTPTAMRLEAELAFFEPSLPILMFPDWETLPYDLFSPHQDIVSTRLATLYQLASQTFGVLILPAATAMQRLAPKTWLDAHCLLVAPGDRLDPTEFRSRLEASGHQCVAQVREHGEFAVRGSIIDLFPMGSEQPYRIDLFDDTVDSIRVFDPDSQISSGKVAAIRLLPAREFPMDENATTRFRQDFRRRFPNSPRRSPLYQDVGEGLAPGGIEYYLPLFFDHTSTLFDYLPKDCCCFSVGDLDQAIGDFLAQVEDRYEQRRHDLERPLLPPAELFLSGAELRSTLGRWQQVRIDGDGPSVLDCRPLPDLKLHPRADDPAAALREFLSVPDRRTLFVVESAGRREVLSDSLKTYAIRLELVDSWAQFLETSVQFALAVAPLEHGLWLDEPSIAIVTEELLSGERVRPPRRRSARKDVENIITNLNELQIGAPVVHEDHGVGRYRGLEILDTGGIRGEYLILEYAGGDRLYVPVSALELVRRYTGASTEAAPLHRLGSEQWQKARSRAAEKVRDVAAELLDLYARRDARPGNSFSIEQEEYRDFAEAFPFEETPDQQAAIEATVADMSRARPMDRVVCGDVGFGKTEVAMRAGFVAVQSGFQVAVLVPTTLLAQQHYQNFLDRFADWPVNIEVMSRFRSRKQQDLVLENLKQGRVDIVIGTHKLLQGDVHFKNLGLVIIDEEHRFGVRHKERLKALRTEVDILTLTATPIPRTMNMSLAGLRDLSIIATPPAERLAVKTFVGQWNDALILEACLRELKRGGQVYLLHNELDTIGRMARDMEKLVPGARVGIAHGQMRERELEQVMMDFHHQRVNLLVCSTIIESGIDVANANTIVINRADRLGLAQLHQLRGRVGRSHHRAYAYLVVPPRKAMTKDAIRRIEAIESMEDLGAGFVLATHDLEIRGAGELLGEEQSGQIHEVGFSLYTELLERAVKAIRAGRHPDLESPIHTGPEVDLRAPALLPDDYLPDVHSRLIMYKRIAGAESEQELRDLQVEMIDRFGLLPEPAKTLFRVAALKLKVAPIGVRKIEAGPEGGRILFEDQPKINHVHVMGLIQKYPQVYRLDGQDRLRFEVTMPNVESRFEMVDNLLNEMAA